MGCESLDRAGLVTHVLDDGRGGRPAVLAQVERHVNLSGLAIGRGNRPTNFTVDCHLDALNSGARQCLEVGNVRSNLCLVGRSEPAIALIDHDGRQRVGRLEAHLGVERLGRLGVAGQPAGRLIVLDVGDLGPEAGKNDYRDQPEGNDDILGPATAHGIGELSIHGRVSSVE